MRRMLIVNSAWPFATVRGPGFTGRVCTRAHVAKFFYPCSPFPCNNACDAGNVAVRVSLTGTATGWKLEGWTIGYLGNQRENHSILLAAYRARGESSSQKTLRCILSSSSLFEFCGFPFLLLSLSNLIVPTHFIHHKYPLALIGQAMARALSTISLDQANVHAEFIDNRYFRPLGGSWPGFRQTGLTAGREARSPLGGRLIYIPLYPLLLRISFNFSAFPLIGFERAE